MNMNLLDLPELVLNKLLGFLEPESLRILRRVSKFTKYLIEQPSNLSRLQVKISRSKRLKFVIKSGIPWNNFRWDLNYGTQGSVGYFQTLLSQFGNTIRVFETERQLNRLELKQLLNLEQLEVLKINSYEDGLELKGGENVECRRKLTNLRTLQICGGKELFDILMQAPNLRTLILLMDYWQRGDLHETDYKELIVNSLIQYVKNRFPNNIPHNYKSHRNSSFSIDFGSPDTGSYIYSHFSLTSDQLLKLCSVCQPVGVKLLNIKSSSLPHLSEMLYDAKKKQSLLCIENVNIFSSTEDLYLPQGIVYSSEIHVKDQTFQSGFKLPRDNVQSISILLNCWAPAFYTTDEELVTDIFDQVFSQRNDLRRLTIKRDTVSSNMEDIFTRENLFGDGKFSIFPNLTSISIQQFHDDPKALRTFYNLCHNCPKLEQLVLEGRLTDDHFLGAAQQSDENMKHSPPLLELKCLKHLEIENWNNGITDKSLIGAFSKMTTLQSLLIKDRCGTVTHKITFNGLEKLLSGGIGESLRHLKIQKPIDCTMSQCKILLRKECKNIKTFNFNDDEEKKPTTVQCKAIFVKR